MRQIRPLLAVAAGMRQRHLVMADDAVVEIGDVQGPIGTELDIDRPKPRIVATQEIGSGTPLAVEPCHSMAIVVDAVGDDVADESAVAALRRKWSAA